MPGRKCNKRWRNKQNDNEYVGSRSFWYLTSSSTVESLVSLFGTLVEKVASERAVKSPKWQKILLLQYRVYDIETVSYQIVYHMKHTKYLYFPFI